MKRNITSYVREIEPIKFCGQLKGLNLKFSGTYEPPFETEPTIGEHDFNNCEGCQNNLIELESHLRKRYEGKHRPDVKPFPYCCEQHSKLVNLREFRKSDFDTVPKLVAHKIIYTYQHIQNNFQKDDYYEDITDYIDYTVESFGQMAGLGSPLYLEEYFSSVTYRLERMTTIPEYKKNRLLQYLSTCQTPTPKKNTDLNILIKTYQKWYKIFPFDIPFLKHLESDFQNKFPILHGRPRTNRYTGVASAKLHSKETLIEALVNLTDELLSTFNSLSLHDQGLLTEPDNIKIELILSERRSKLKRGYVSQSKDEETRYRKILKEWYADEKRFIDEITPILRKLPAQKANKVKLESLSNLITHEKSTEIVENLKIQYKNIRGKRLKLLLLALQELNLLPKERIANKFHSCCKREFDWDIASYNAMNGYEYNVQVDGDEVSQMKVFLSGLIISE